MKQLILFLITTGLLACEDSRPPLEPHPTPSTLFSANAATALGTIAIVDALGAATPTTQFSVFGSGGRTVADFQHAGPEFTLTETTTLTEIGGFLNNCKDITAGVPQCPGTLPFMVQVRPSVNGVPDASTVLASFAMSHDDDPLVVSYESVAISLTLEPGRYFALFVPQGNDEGAILSDASAPFEYRAGNITVGFLNPLTGASTAETEAEAAVRILGIPAMTIPQGLVTVDGAVEADEWGSALRVPLIIPLLDGSSVSADVRLLHDGVNLYASVRVQRTGVTTILGLIYDNDRDGIEDNGDDDIWGSSLGVRTDAVITRCETQCGPENDAFLGGTNDVSIASRTTADAVELELAHPLASGDVYDVSVGADGRLGLSLLVSLLTPSDQFLGASFYPGVPHFGQFIVAEGAPLTPQQAIQALMTDVEALVGEGVLSPAQGDGLLDKLAAAIPSLDRGRPKAACNQLHAFVNQVNGLVGAGRLSAGVGQELVDTGAGIRTQIGCA